MSVLGGLAAKETRQSLAKVSGCLFLLYLPGEVQYTIARVHSLFMEYTALGNSKWSSSYLLESLHYQPSDTPSPYADVYITSSTFYHTPIRK